MQLCACSQSKVDRLLDLRWPGLLAAVHVRKRRRPGYATLRCYDSSALDRSLNVNRRLLLPTSLSGRNHKISGNLSTLACVWPADEVQVVAANIPAIVDVPSLMA